MTTDDPAIARAAEAAGAQGKFWELHDRLFKAPALTRADLEREAEAAGLAMPRFLARAPRGSVARASAESTELAWFSPAEARAAAIEDSVLRLFRLAFRR